ncbi:MAG: vanadium-dependent haloperoxidase [Chlamydiales bacterium]|nr:vanadium-dependent haloperoxidase [Chlamydiales bacterium]
MSKRVPLALSLLLTVTCFTQGFTQELGTYFPYSKEDLEKLRSEKTIFQFTKEELKKWDGFIAEAFEEDPASLTLLRISTYLYVSQQEAAKLSKYAKGKLAGSLDPVSFRVITLFLPDLKKPADYKEDAYSSFLAEMIGKKIEARLKEEDGRKIVFEVPKNLREHYFVGLKIAKWLPWYAIPATAYWPPPPPPPSNTAFWDAQIEEIKRQQHPLTDEKKRAILLWAGKEDPNRNHWRLIANDYLFSHNVSLPKMLRVRSTLAMTLYDAFIVSFQTKYAYLVLRPSIYDPDLETVINVPKHPSYPANHSVIASAAATILSHFFPAEGEHWSRLKEESSRSRIWAAVHYPIDDQEGRRTGKRVAEAVLKQIN